MESKQLKIKTMRRSGLPVSPEHLEAYKSEWREGFDMAVSKHGREMLGLNAELAELEKVLNTKYATVVEWDIPATAEETIKLIEKYGNILMARHSETNELVYVIEDNE